jgi:hypothetical protein
VGENPHEVTIEGAELDLFSFAQLNRPARDRPLTGAQSLGGPPTKWAAISQGLEFGLSLKNRFRGA